jgi:hypothetical protein
LSNVRKILLSIGVGLSAACAGLTATASAETLQPLHVGYAFDHPRILVQQRLFGLAHGVKLLATACADEPDYRAPTAQAYSAWNERQAATIEGATRDLARYYFGESAVRASQLDIVQALKLKDKLAFRPGSQPLQAACNTLPQALEKPRYDLQTQYRLQFLASRLQRAHITEAEAEACTATLSDNDALPIKDSLAQWRSTYAPRLEEAQTALEKSWPESQLEGTLATLLTAARAQGKRVATAAHCKTLAARLLTDTFDPDAAFNAEP